MDRQPAMKIETSMTIVILIVLFVCVLHSITAHAQDLTTQPHDSLTSWICMVIGGTICYLLGVKFK